jgi:FtsP/CotA-like multicopper oxidase with cupredoxin domain
MPWLWNAIFFLLLFLLPAAGQVTSCPPRPAAGSTVSDPPVLQSKNGALSVDLTILNSTASDGSLAYCYIYGDGSREAPTLVANPGDTVTINLTNQLTATTGMEMKISKMPSSDSPCSSGVMTSASSNIHFHGLNIPPKCHQDEVITTVVQPGDPPYKYSFQIPVNEPPGLYWYHPHPHGFTAPQVIGGAAGALIVGGIEKVRPEVAGLSQRVFVIRQHSMTGSDDGAGLSINFVPADVKLVIPRITVDASESEFWRVLNASSVSFLQLELVNNGALTNMQLVALDGVPLSSLRNTQTIVIPPAGRAEFIMQTPSSTGLEQLFNAGFDTGPGGDPNPPVLVADVVPSGDQGAGHMPTPYKLETLHRFQGLMNAKTGQQRKLYFSESADGTQFFITVVGHKPKIYEPSDPPSIVTQQGAVEDWIIENRSTEVHAFHLHQLHFVLMEINGVPTKDPALRDTVVVPYWDGTSSQYPSIKIRVDFRDPEVVGTFVYHCHILDHEDGGMMAKIKVLPAN